MPSSMIDGTIETVTVKRKLRNITIFDTIVVRQADGQQATFKKMVTAEPVAGAIQPGLKARLYMFAAFDLKGVHGIRSSDGKSLFAFPTNNEKIMLGVAFVSLALVLVWFFMDDKLALLPLALIVLGTVGYIFYRLGRSDATRQFRADSAYTPPA